MSIFLGHECASMFLIFVRKYKKYTINRCGVYAARSVCFRGDFPIMTVR